MQRGPVRAERGHLSAGGHRRECSSARVAGRAAGAVAHGGALEGSGWAGARGVGPPALPALEAGGSGLAAGCALMELLAAAGGWVLLPPRLPASVLPEPRLKGKRRAKEVCLRRRGPGSPGSDQGSPRSDRTGPGLKAVRTGFCGQVTGAILWFPFWSEVVNAPHLPFTRASRAHALCTRGCPATLSSLTSQDAGVNRVWVLAPVFRILQTLCPPRLGQQHLVGTVGPEVRRAGC